MGIYLRKSISVGPLRFNLSGSGVGVSTGVKGFRVGTGPRGNYVHVGSHGIYYRATLPRALSPPAVSPAEPAPSPPLLVAPDGLTEIESGSIAEMADSSSVELLNEINEKARLPTWWPIVTILLGLLSLVASNVLLAAVGPLWAILLGIPALAAALWALIWVKGRDELRKTVVLMYELEPIVESAYQSFVDAFERLASSARVWHLQAAGRNTDWKRQAGATTIVRRSAIAPRRAEPPRLRTNVATPVLTAGRQTLYFFPDRLLVFEGRAVGAVSYTDLAPEAGVTRFIENESVPPDAKVVDHTWQYVNKRGGPDRRFNNNRQLPIALYGELYLRSASGLNEAFQTSNAEVPAQFATGIAVLARALSGSAPLPLQQAGLEATPTPPTRRGRRRAPKPA